MKPREFVKEYGIQSLVCCFSGGKDSLVATHYTLEEIRGIESRLEIHVVFVDTTVMLPITIKYVREVCNRYGWPLKILKPEPDFWTLAKRWGVPSLRRRWCCFYLKLKPIFEFTRKLAPQRGMVTGLRREESERRRSRRHVEYVKRMKGLEVLAWNYHPILEWTEKDVLRYIRDHDLPMPPHYRMGIKETCMCGAFTHVRELLVMKALYPDLFRRFVELERDLGEGRSAWFDGKQVFASELAKQKTLDETGFKSRGVEREEHASPAHKAEKARSVVK